MSLLLITLIIMCFFIPCVIFFPGINSIYCSVFCVVLIMYIFSIMGAKKTANCEKNADCGQDFSNGKCVSGKCVCNSPYLPPNCTRVCNKKDDCNGGKCLSDGTCNCADMNPPMMGIRCNKQKKSDTDLCSNYCKAPECDISKCNNQGPDAACNDGYETDATLTDQDYRLCTIERCSDSTCKLPGCDNQKCKSQGQVAACNDGYNTVPLSKELCTICAPGRGNPIEEGKCDKQWYPEIKKLPTQTSSDKCQNPDVHSNNTLTQYCIMDLGTHAKYVGPNDWCTGDANPCRGNNCKGDAKGDWLTNTLKCSVQGAWADPDWNPSTYSICTATTPGGCTPMMPPGWVKGGPP